MSSEIFGRYVNVVDVEATCWSGRPPAGQSNEIIEIGVCVLDTTEWRRVGRHRILVRPRRSSVSAFCTELTGLTQAEVDAGAEFADACARVRDELRGRSRTWASWGEYDRRQFERQCAPGGAEYPFGRRHVNLKQRFAEVFGLPKAVGMSRALELAGLPLEGRQHRGDDDAWNIGALAVEVARRGQSCDTEGSSCPEGGARGVADPVEA
jgi:inhibitor of KinA sporulation pathway (predicted exonuclease)